MILYKWTILAGIVAAPALALLGAQLATRDRAMQTLCVGQGAMVGVLLGMAILSPFESPLLNALGPFFSAIFVSVATIVITDAFVARRTASKNTFFAFTFALLLAAGHLVSSLFPALENHLAQIYFGDLATLNILQSKMMLGISLVCLGLLLGMVRSISNQSFEWAVFGDLVSSKGERKGMVAFKLVTLLMLCLSVQLVGFLFTIAMLFLPTALMNFSARKGLFRHLCLSGAIALVSTVSGFLLSLQYTRLPTVPAIVAVMFVLALVTLGIERAVTLIEQTSNAREFTKPRAMVTE